MAWKIIRFNLTNAPGLAVDSGILASAIFPVVPETTVVTISEFNRYLASVA